MIVQLDRRLGHETKEIWRQMGGWCNQAWQSGVSSWLGVAALQCLACSWLPPLHSELLWLTWALRLEGSCDLAQFGVKPSVMSVHVHFLEIYQRGKARFHLLHDWHLDALHCAVKTTQRLVKFCTRKVNLESFISKTRQWNPCRLLARGCIFYYFTSKYQEIHQCYVIKRLWNQDKSFILTSRNDTW